MKRYMIYYQAKKQVIVIVSNSYEAFSENFEYLVEHNLEIINIEEEEI